MAKAAEPFVVGGCSACLASSIIHPIDLSKVRLQLYATQNPGVPVPSFVGLLSKMIREEGISSIYAGLSAALMRQAVYGTARIGLHRSFSAKLQELYDNQPLSFGAKAACGMGSGAIAVVIGTPFDVSLVRMQADSMKPLSERRGYKNVFHALQMISKHEGASKLYSGLAPNILRGMSMNVGMLACFDQAKEFISANITNEAAGSPASKKTQLMASMVAGFTAAAFSLPFDLLKSRMQDGSKYKSLMDAAYKTLTKEGFFAFWTGFSAYYMRCAPHSMIILMATEPIAEAYKGYFLTK